MRRSKTEPQEEDCAERDQRARRRSGRDANAGELSVQPAEVPDRRREDGQESREYVEPDDEEEPPADAHAG
jgi:hypothetical protein